jgi:hypothetical protein
MLNIDFSAIRSGKVTYAEQISHISYKDLRLYTDEVFQAVKSSISSATDALISFVPHDPQSTEGDERGWTIGHVITHITAAFEEAAATASVLARGVKIEDGLRLRYETPWEELQTLQQVQARLAESQRMSHAYLDAWPEPPHLDVMATPVPTFGPVNAIGMYVFGIGHAQMHCEQLKEIVRQAQTSNQA